MTTAKLRPCHVTGEHEPDHHLRLPGVCNLQAREVAEQLLAGATGSGPLEGLPRELHPSCYWCGTSEYQGQRVARAAEQAAWAAAGPQA